MRKLSRIRAAVGRWSRSRCALQGGVRRAHVDSDSRWMITNPRTAVVADGNLASSAAACQFLRHDHWFAGHCKQRGHTHSGRPWGQIIAHYDERAMGHICPRHQAFSAAAPLAGPVRSKTSRVKRTIKSCDQTVIWHYLSPIVPSPTRRWCAQVSNWFPDVK